MSDSSDDVGSREGASGAYRTTSVTCRVARIRCPAASAASRRVKARGTRGARRVLRYSMCGPDVTVTLRCHSLFLFRQIVISWSPAIFTRCLSTVSCMHETVGLDDLSPVLFFIASRQWSHDSSDRVRVPAWPHGVRDHPIRFLVPTSSSRVYCLIPPEGRGREQWRCCRLLCACI